MTATSRPYAMALAAGLLAGLSLVACTEEAASIGSTGDQPADGANCHTSRQRPDGGCCAVGSVYRLESDTCLAVGLASCAPLSMSALHACVPRWCWDRLDLLDKPCASGAADCQARGRPCSDDELKAGDGCAAGARPSSGACVPAGLSGDATSALAAPGPVLAPPDLPDVAPIAETRFCHDADAGHLRLCAADEPGCGSGQSPDPVQPDSCIPFGAPWLCPPGFISVAAGGSATRCIPDPSDCGETTFAPTGAGPGVFHVDPSVSGVGQGTKVAPYSKLASAIAAANSWSGKPIIALAKGTYTLQFKIKVPMEVRGRCAAQVTLLGVPQTYSVVSTGANSPQKVIIRGISIKGGTPAVAAGPGPTLRLERVWVQGAGGFGVAASGAGAHLQLVESVVADGQVVGDGPGAGAAATKGSLIEATDVLFENNRGAGVWSTGAGSRFVGHRVRIRGTETWPGGKLMSGGVLVDFGGRATLRSATVQDSREVGVVAVGAGAHAQLVATLVRDGLPRESDGKAGYGVTVRHGATMELHGVRLSGNRNAGLAVDGPSVINARGLLVDDTEVNKGLPYGGQGVAVFHGGLADVRGGRLHANRGAGMHVHGQGSRLVAHDLVVDATRAHPDSGLLGMGAFALGGGQITLHNVRFSKNRVVGLQLRGAGTSGSATDLLVDQTLGEQDTDAWGIGIFVGDGADLQLTRGRVSGSPYVGIWLMHQDSRLLATELLIDAAGQGQPVENVKYGMVINFGASASVLGARIHAARGAGLLVEEVGSRLDAEGLLIDGTRGQFTDGDFGMGLVANRGARLRLSGARLTGNRLAGAMIAGMNDPERGLINFAAVASMSGVVVDKTQSRVGVNSQGETYAPYGVGVLVETGVVEFSLSGSLLSGNRSAGLVFDNASGSVSETVIRDTVPEKYVPLDWSGGRDTKKAVILSDGIVAFDAKGLKITRGLIHGNERAGLLLSKYEATLEHSIITGSVFGLATDEGSTLHQVANALVDNDTNRAGSKGLVVPPSPNAVVPVEGDAPEAKD